MDRRQTGPPAWISTWSTAQIQAAESLSLLSSHKIFKMTVPTTTPQIFLLRTGEWFGLLALRKCATMLVFNFTAVQRFVKTQSFRRPIC